MCSLAIAGLAISAVSTVSQMSRANSQSYDAQVAQNAQIARQNDQIRLQNEAAARQYQMIEQQRTLDQHALATRATELHADAANAKADIASQAAVIRARQLVASSESGLGGNTAARLLRDIGFESGLQGTRIDTTYKREVDQITRDQEAVNLSAGNRNNAVQTAQPITDFPAYRPAVSGLSGALAIGGDVFKGISDGAFTTQSSRNTSTPKSNKPNSPFINNFGV